MENDPMNESELKAAHAVVIEHYRALREHDRDAMDVTLHPNFLFVSPWGKVYKKPEYLEIFFKQAGSAPLVGEPTLLSMEITAPIATAVVLEIRGNTVIDGRTFKGTIHANHTLVKSSGKWLFLACYFGTE